MKLSVARKPVTRNLIALMVALVAISFAATASAQPIDWDIPMPPTPLSTAKKPPPKLAKKVHIKVCPDGRHVAKGTPCLTRVPEPHICHLGRTAGGSCKTLTDLRTELELAQLERDKRVGPYKPDPSVPYFWIVIFLTGASGLCIVGFHVYSSTGRRLRFFLAKLKENEERLLALRIEEDKPWVRTCLKCGAGNKPDAVFCGNCCVRLKSEEDELMEEAYAEIEAYLSGDDFEDRIEEQYRCN